MATKKKKPKTKRPPKKPAAPSKTKTKSKAKKRAKAKSKPLKSKRVPKKNPFELEKSFLIKVPYKDFDLLTLFTKSREIIRCQGIEESALHQFQTAVGKLIQSELAWDIYDPEEIDEESDIDFSDDAQACAYTKMAIEEENAFHFFALSPFLTGYAVGSQCPFIDGTTFEVEAGEAETTSCYGVLLIKQGGDLYAFKAGSYDDIGTRISPVEVPTLWEEKATAFLRSLTLTSSKATPAIKTTAAHRDAARDNPSFTQREAEELWHTVSRNPFEGDIGYRSSDGCYETHTLFFKTEKELLEHLVALDSTVEVCEEDDFIALRDSLIVICKKYTWTLSTELMQEINKLFSGRHEVMWWGSFAAEFAKGEQGYFAGELEGILEEFDEAEVTDAAQLSAEAKQAIAESLAEA